MNQVVVSCAYDYKARHFVVHNLDSGAVATFKGRGSKALAEEFRQAIKQAHTELTANGYKGIGQEETDCLTDASRADESFSMIDHWEARCSLSGGTRADLAAFVVNLSTARGTIGELQEDSP
jgi:hypothetical protein